MTLKESAIRDYMKNIDFTSENWSLSDIKRDMRKFLGEEPGVDVIYKKDVFVNEATMKSEEIVNIDKVQIVYYDTDEKFKKLEFRIGA